jgi:hypothetical protein
MISRLRQKWSRLISQVEKEEGRKFKKRPSLRFHDGRPKSSQIIHKTRARGRVTRVTRPRVTLSRTMARDQEKVAILSAKHELRELLLEQSGWSRTRAHRRAQAHEKVDRRKLGLTKSYGWLAKEHFGR